MSNQRPKVAVVEDEEALLKVLAEWLALEGYEVISMTDGRQALEMIPNSLPDLILLDLILPEVDGFTVMKQLIADPRTKTIPVVVLTNLGDDESRRHALELGAKNYLVKAEYNLDQISQTVAEVLQNKEQ